MTERDEQFENFIVEPFPHSISIHSNPEVYYKYVWDAAWKAAWKSREDSKERFFTNG